MMIAQFLSFVVGGLASAAYFHVTETRKKHEKLAEMYLKAEKDGWAYGPPDD